MAKLIDLDNEFGFLAPTDEPAHVKNIKVFGQEVRVVCDLNAMALTGMMSEGAGAAEILGFIRSMIHPEDWPAFRAAATNSPSLAGEGGMDNLVKLMQKLTQVASERPTTSPSALPRGGASRATTRKSGGRSSGAPVAALKKPPR